jgi:serine/threonine-protein kinase
MRSLANSYHMAYVTSSRDELQLMCHNRDISDSPFFNIFSNLPLRPFTRDEALDLISTPSKKEGVPLETHAGRIIDLAGLFPFYLQIACSGVFEHLLDNPETEPDWDQIVKSFKDESYPHYSHVWERMDEQERENLRRIASGKPIGKKYGFVSDNLARKGYLVESSGTVSMCSSSFADFVLSQPERSSRKKSLFSSIFDRKKA